MNQHLDKLAKIGKLKAEPFAQGEFSGLLDLRRSASRRC